MRNYFLKITGFILGLVAVLALALSSSSSDQIIGDENIEPTTIADGSPTTICV